MPDVPGPPPLGPGDRALVLGWLADLHAGSPDAAAAALAEAETSAAARTGRSAADARLAPLLAPTGPPWAALADAVLHGLARVRAETFYEPPGPSAL